MTEKEFRSCVDQIRRNCPIASLMLAGKARGDNGSGFQLKAERDMPWEEHKNRFPKLFGRPWRGKDDFVWLGLNAKVRVPRPGGGGEGGGHPALAGMNAPFCAGELLYEERPWINFKSGHYHPRLQHAVHFVCHMVEQSLVDYAGDADTLVQKIGAMRLRIYRGDEEESAYVTNFDDIVEQMGFTVTRAASPPVVVDPSTFNLGAAVEYKKERLQECKCCYCKELLGNDSLVCGTCEQKMHPGCRSETWEQLMRSMVCKNCFNA
jgi:hypothetical protein